MAVLGSLVGWLARGYEAPVVIAPAPAARSSGLRLATTPAPAASQAVLSQPLLQFPDDKPLYGNIWLIMSLPGDKNPNMSSVPEGDWYWPMIKHKGVLYVRGWIGGKPSAKTLKDHWATIGSQRWTKGLDSLAGTKPHQITFRFENARWSTTPDHPDHPENVNVIGADLDEHAYEKW